MFRPEVQEQIDAARALGHCPRCKRPWSTPAWPQQPTDQAIRDHMAPRDQCYN